MLVERAAVTLANVNDERAGPDALPDDPGEVFADCAYRGPLFGCAVRAWGGTPRVVLTAMWGRDEQETLGRMRDWNRPLRRVRERIEKIVGTWKRTYSCGGCDGEAFLKPPSKSILPPLPTTSNAPSTSSPPPSQKTVKRDRIG